MDGGQEINDPNQETRNAAIQIATLTRIITRRARNNPNDEELQQRARFALGFYNKVAAFVQVDEIPGEDGPHIGYLTTNNDDLVCRHLPTEIYEAVIGHVLEFEYSARQRTLISLSASSKRLRYLAEPHLYNRPRGAHSIERQWRFMFSLVLEPQRGHLVQSLEFQWYPRPDNSDLIIDILHACPNVRDLQIQRGSSMSDVALITREESTHLANIFAASPRVTQFWYATFTEWLPENLRYGREQQEIYRLCQWDARFAKFAAQLQKLTLHGQANWLARALLLSLSPTLKSLTLGQDTDLDFWPHPLLTLSHCAPHLEILEMRCTLDNGEDLINACKIWTTSLRDLRVNYIKFSNSCLGDVVKTLEVLESLHLGHGCVLTQGDLEAIAQSLPQQRFKTISIKEMDTTGSILPTWADRIERIIESLMVSHSSTLTEVYLDPHTIQLGKRMILSCKQMTNLEDLHVTFSSDVTAADVDALLESCPKLHSVPRQVQELSLQPEEWEERYVAKEREFHAEFERLPPLLG
jgi:hypothetical protein